MRSKVIGLPSSLALSLCATSLFAFLFSANTSAREMTNNSNVHVAGGIAMPSTSTSVFTNPAGLVGASTALSLQAGAPKFWENGTYRAGLQTGGANFGVAGGIERRDQPGNDATLGYYGLAVGTSGFSLGLAGKTGISNADGTNLNAGLLFAVGSSAQVGVTAHGLDDGVNEWGAGVAFNVANGVSLVFDAAADDDLDNLEMKPGLRVGGGPAALTLSYGTGARQQFADGFTAGASYQFSSSVLEIQYNAGGDLSKYFAALTLGF